MTIERVLKGLSRPSPGLRGMVVAKKGLVCSAHPLASFTGAKVMETGGNFMDAAIATSAVLNVVEPYNSSLGGDAFMLAYRSSDGSLKAINSSGPAPSAASAEAFPDGVPARGAMAVSVPGQVGAWKVAHEEYATWTWKRLLRPAIQYATGFACNARLSWSIKAAARELRAQPAWRDTFLQSGTAPEPGDIFAQKDLARSLRILATEGPDDFYQGTIAERIASCVGKSGGLLAKEDLSRYEAEVLNPIRTKYRGLDVFEQPPVSQGHILLEELNIVEGYDLSSLQPDGPDAVHLLVEAMKLAFADRHRYAGDPRFVGFRVDRIIDKKHAARRRSLIHSRKARATYPAQGTSTSDTTYFAVADGEGNAVSFIQSLFHGFGSGLVVPGTGILLNDRMAGFSLDPASPNVLAAGKRTVHTLNTYMVFHEGRPLFIGGTPGGDRQVQTNLQIITRLLDWGMNVQQAVEAPRWASAGGLLLHLESRYPRPTVRALCAMGHRVDQVGPWGAGGAVQLIMIHPATRALIGGSDPRCDGCAIGF